MNIKIMLRMRKSLVGNRGKTMAIGLDDSLRKKKIVINYYIIHAKCNDPHRTLSYLKVFNY
jgi:hypothetical protein